jgi:hypothetical protein
MEGWRGDREVIAELKRDKKKGGSGKREREGVGLLKSDSSASASSSGVAPSSSSFSPSAAPPPSSPLPVQTLTASSSSIPPPLSPNVFTSSTQEDDVVSPPVSPPFDFEEACQYLPNPSLRAPCGSARGKQRAQVVSLHENFGVKLVPKAFAPELLKAIKDELFEKIFAKKVTYIFSQIVCLLSI